MYMLKDKLRFCIRFLSC